MPAELLQETLVHVLRDVSFHCDLLGSSSIDQDINTVNRRASVEGIGFFTKSLPALGRCLDKALASDDPMTTDHSFGLSKRAPYNLPVFLGSLFHRIFDTSGKVAACPEAGEAAQVQAVKAVRQICFLFYKLELPYAPELEVEVLDNFVSTDTLLPVVGADPPLPLDVLRTLESARMAIWYVLKDFNPLVATPRHGPGAVSTGEKQWEKYNFRRFYSFLDKEWSYPDFFYLNYEHLVDELGNLEDMDEVHEAEAKVALVPKDSRGPRIISMEPLELQWIQQGVMRELYSLMERAHSYTYGHVNFTDQEINRALALEHSHNGSYITMDLKDASDRVSRWLAEKLLPKHVFKKLDACRSQFTRLPDGRRVELRKFAPMGSGICFPIEALLFWGIAVGSLKTIRRERDMKSLPDVFVYGDDIILPREGYEVVREAYEALYLRVNQAKCCTGRFFRESCGMDAFKLNDVTPIRVKTPIVDTLSPAACLSWVGYVNSLRERGYSLTADFLQDVITHRIPFPVPVVRNRRGLALAYYEPLLDDCTMQDYLGSAFKTRYSRAYQRTEIRIPVCVPHQISVVRDGWSGLFECLLSRGGPPDPFGFSDRRVAPDCYLAPYLNKLGWKWVDMGRLTDCG